MFAVIGGLPSFPDDSTMSSIFLVMFCCGLSLHTSIFIVKALRNYMPFPSAITAVFCAFRILACSLRIAGALNPTRIHFMIEEDIFVSAGVLLLMLLNFILMQRMLRSAHPNVGWSRAASYAFKTLYAVVSLTLVIDIVTTVLAAYSRGSQSQEIERTLRSCASSIFTLFAFLPLLILPYIRFAPRRQSIDKFGRGSWTFKFFIVGIISALLTLGAGFRTGVKFMHPRPVADPAWYHHKAAFYAFNFGIELVVVFIYLFVNTRFYVPDGSSKIKSYSGCTSCDAIYPVDNKLEDAIKANEWG